MKSRTDKDTDLTLIMVHAINFIAVGVSTWEMFKKPDSQRSKYYNIVKWLSLVYGCVILVFLVIFAGIRLQNIILFYFYLNIPLFGTFFLYSEGYAFGEFDNIISSWSRFVVTFGFISCLLILAKVALNENEDYNRYIITVDL